METKPVFNLGDTVFYAEAHEYAQVDAPCPVCFGKLSVTVILGNGETQPVACEFCERGWDGPRGSCKVAAPYSAVHESPVKGIRQEHDGEWKYEVNHGHWKVAAELHRTREEAEAVRVVLAEKAAKAAEDRRDSHAMHGKKSLTWRVGYYRRQLEEARRCVAFYERKLSESKAEKKEAVGGA